jgi:hypothetical protein
MWKIAGILLIAALLIAGMAGHFSPLRNPEIRTWYDLDAVRNNLDGNYILMNDLDSATPGYEELAGWTANQGQGWQPIGIGSAPTGFNGTFDGQGYEIRELSINRTDGLVVGLFSEVGQGGVVKNLGMANSYVNFFATETGSTSVCKCAGGLVGENYGTVDSCCFTGGVGGNFSAGCLVGRNYGTVKNSYSTGQVRGTGTGTVGGLVGDNGGLVRNCYSTSFVSLFTGGTGGGLVGRNIGGAVMYSYSTGGVRGGEICGGLVAVNNGSVSRCYATGGVGVFGKNMSSGGLVGLNNGSVSDSYSTGGVTGNLSVGGLVGFNDVRGTVQSSYSTGAVNGYGHVGGLVGRNGGTVTDSFWDTETSGQATSAGGTGTSTAEMQDIATFVEMAWDITGVAPDRPDHSYIWNIVDSTGYPFLSWFLGCHEGHTSPTQMTTGTAPSGYLQLTVLPAAVCANIGEQIKVRCSINCLINTIVEISSVDVLLFDPYGSMIREQAMTKDSYWSAHTEYTIVGDEAYYKVKVNFTIRGDGKYSDYGVQSFPITVGTSS